MKILCVIDSLGSGGAQRQLVELAIGFQEKGHTVSFLTYHNITFYNPILEKAGISITCILEPNYLRRLFKMRRFIRQGKYNAVLSFLEAANFICEISGLPFRKWKLVVGERSANPNILKSIKLRIFRWLHIFADYVVANSNANIQLIYSINPCLSNSKCKVIYNIVDFGYWKPTSDYIPRINGKLHIVVAASHRYLKNLNGLIDALALLKRDDQNKLEINWYGDGLTQPFIDNSFADAKIKIKALNLERLISFRPATIKLTQEIQKADVIALFSFYEGLPNSVCEGMACAKPIICSGVSDLPSLIGYNKNFVFNPFEPSSIANAISYILSLSNDQLVQTGKKNLQIANKNFAKDNIINEYLKLLQ